MHSYRAVGSRSTHSSHTHMFMHMHTYIYTHITCYYTHITQRFLCDALHMVPSPRGKRWTVPDSSADATAGEGHTLPPEVLGLSCHVTHLPVLDIAATSHSSLPSEAAAIAAFEAPPLPIRMDGLDFTSFHAFHRAGSNVETGAEATAKTILLSIRSEIRKDQSVLRATRKYLGPCGCLSFLVVQTIAHLEEKMKKMMVDADGDGKVLVCAA
jgi:hypothetical protein